MAFFEQFYLAYMSDVIKSILFEDAYWKINKTLVKEIGIEPTVLLTDIIEKYYYFIKENTSILREGRHWFYYRSEDIKINFGISYKVQKRIIAELTEKGFILTKLYQTPAKLHIHFVENTVESLLLSSFYKRANLELLKGENKISLNGQSNKEYTNNNSLTKVKEGVLPFEESELKKRRSKFVKPTIDEIKLILTDKKLAQKFFNHYESNGWVVGKTKMVDWKASANNWKLEHEDKHEPSPEGFTLKF